MARDAEHPDSRGADGHPRNRGRRRFLALAAGGVTAAALGGWAGSRLLEGAGVGARAASARLASVLRQPGEPVVVEVSHPLAVGSDGGAQGEAVLEMVDAAMSRLTGEKERARAWASLFSPRDTVAIKVNCLAAPRASTHPEVVKAAIAGLRSAGVPEDSIIIYDRLNHELERGGFVINTGRGVRCFGSDVAGYDDNPTEVGSVGSCLSRIVSQMCTAIINMPVVKDHDLAGVTIALKNHFGSINNPNKQHEHNCCPQIADLNCFPPLRDKQRLVIADALTVVYDGGPAYKPRSCAAYRSLLVGRDAVAVDAVGLDIIEKLRRGAGLGSLAAEGRHPRHISVAADAEHRLGVADLGRIRRLRVALGQASLP